MNLSRQLLTVILATIAAGSSLNAREWADSTGTFKVQAAFVRIEGEQVHLKRDDTGDVITVPVSRLSEADRAFLQSLADNRIDDRFKSGITLKRDDKNWDEDKTCVAVSPNGKIVATASWSGRIRLWDVGSGTELPSSMGYSGGGGNARLAFSKNGKLLVSSNGTKQVIVWDVETRKRHATLSNQMSVGYVTFSNDGRRLACAGYGYANEPKSHEVCIWDLGLNKVILKLEKVEATARVTCAELSPDGKLLATSESGAKGVVRLWDTANGQQLFAFNQDAHTTSLTFSPDGKYLVSGCYGGKIFVWDVTTRADHLSLTYAPLDVKQVSSIAVLPDNKTLLTCAIWGRDAAITYWDLVTGKKLTDGVVKDCGRLALSLDAKTVALYQNERSPEVKLWPADLMPLISTNEVAKANELAEERSKDSNRLPNTWKLSTPPDKWSQTELAWLHLKIKIPPTDKGVEFNELKGFDGRKRYDERKAQFVNRDREIKRLLVEALKTPGTADDKKSEEMLFQLPAEIAFYSWSADRNLIEVCIPIAKDAASTWPSESGAVAFDIKDARLLHEAGKLVEGYTGPSDGVIFLSITLDGKVLPDGTVNGKARGAVVLEHEMGPQFNRSKTSGAARFSDVEFTLSRVR